MDDKPPAGAERIRRMHREHIMPGVLQYYREPIAVAQASGLRVIDVEGRSYLDFFGGILTVGLGHGHPGVLAAIAKQAERFVHISSLYTSEPLALLAQRLAGITPAGLSQCYFTTTGTEADETAVMLAQLSTGRSEIIALRHGYSGRSLLAQNLNACSPWRALSSQIAGIKHALCPYCYRCPLKLEPGTCRTQCARDIEELIATATSGQVAAFLAEPILGVGGFITPPREYFEIAVEIVRRHGGLFICDEVQSGFGRTGRMFAIEHYGVEPEIMTMAKAVANGLPLGVTIATSEVAAALKRPTISTFGGNPLSCAAANATLDAFEQEEILARGERAGHRLMEGLRALQRSYSAKIGEVRGKGLMIGVEIVRDEGAGDRSPDTDFLGRVFEASKERGLLVGKGGLYGNVLRIAPALVASDDEVDEGLEILGAAFAEATDD